MTVPMERSTIRAGDRRVLMFAYYYPPCTCFPTASARAAGFANYLSDFGWTPIVITRRDSSGSCKCLNHNDEALDKQFPRIIRLSIRNTALRRFRDRRHDERPGPLSAIARRFATLLLNLTEQSDDWAATCIAVGDELITEESVDAIWTTSAPYRSINIGRRLAKRSGLPWIADLRDALSRPPVRKPSVAVPSAIRRRWYAHMVRSADRVVAVTPEERNRDLPWLRTQVDVIPSGFDPQDWIPLQDEGKPSANDAIRIAYLGKVHPAHDPEAFFRGLHEHTIRQGGGSNIQFDYFGPTWSPVNTAARAARVDRMVNDHGTVTSDQARKVMLQSDILLLLTIPSLSGVPGGKLYEYLASTTPILAVPAGDSYVEQVLAQVDGGQSASTPSEIDEALTVLSRADSRRSKGHLDSLIHAFGWPSRARSLASILDSLIDDSAR